MRTSATSASGSAGGLRMRGSRRQPSSPPTRSSSAGADPELDACTSRPAWRPGALTHRRCGRHRRPMALRIRKIVLVGSLALVALALLALGGPLPAPQAPAPAAASATTSPASSAIATREWRSAASSTGRASSTASPHPHQRPSCKGGAEAHGPHGAAQVLRARVPRRGFGPLPARARQLHPRRPERAGFTARTSPRAAATTVRRRAIVRAWMHSPGTGRTSSTRSSARSASALPAESRRSPARRRHVHDRLRDAQALTAPPARARRPNL